MRTFLIILTFVVVLGVETRAQPLSNDTVVCIIDTSRCFVQFTEKPFPDRNPDLRWQISIKGHYYDLRDFSDDYKDFASIGFKAIYLSRVIGGEKFSGPFEVTKNKTYIKEKYIVADEEWIHNQTDFNLMSRKLGSFPFSKYNFIVFKNDFEKTGKDSVVMHRVTIAYSEVVF